MRDAQKLVGSIPNTPREHGPERPASLKRGRRVVLSGSSGKPELSASRPGRLRVCAARMVGEMSVLRQEQNVASARGYRFKPEPLPEQEALSRQFPSVCRLVHNLGPEQRATWERHRLRLRRAGRGSYEAPRRVRLGARRLFRLPATGAARPRTGVPELLCRPHELSSAPLARRRRQLPGCLGARLR